MSLCRRFLRRGDEKLGPFILGLWVRSLGLEPRTCGLRVEKRSSRPVPASPTEGQNPAFSKVDRRCCPHWNRRVSADPSFVGHFLDNRDHRRGRLFRLLNSSGSAPASPTCSFDPCRSLHEPGRRQWSSQTRCPPHQRTRPRSDTKLQRRRSPDRHIPNPRVVDPMIGEA